MASKIDICNLALGNIEAGFINTLDEDNAKARQCKLRYPLNLDLVLADAWWNFATKNATLARLSATPDEWNYQYSLPADYLAARYIVPDTGSGTDGLIRERRDGRPEPARIEYEIAIDSTGSKVLMTNEDSVVLRYTFRQTDTTKFSPHFVIAMSWYLGADLAIPIVGSETGRKLRDVCLQAYGQSMASAIATNEMEDYLGKPRDPELIEVRQT